MSSTEQGILPFKQYVYSLFECMKDNPNSVDIHIRMEDNSITTVELVEKKDKITVIMNNVEMGYFEEYTAKGYRCRFHQKYRVGIGKGRTLNEAFMESICDDNQYIVLDKAYG